jgi:hypothetical protein
MSNAQQPPAKKLNASQRLEVAETNIQELLMYINNMARDLTVSKQAIKLLGNKLDAVAKASGLSAEQISEIMIDNNVEELRQKVDEFLLQGILVPGALVTDQSFVVGHEIDKDDKVANKRLQFSVGAVKPELREKLIGASVGSTITFNEESLRYVVDEIYTIVNPEAEQAPQTEAAPAAETTEEAKAQA